MAGDFDYETGGTGYATQRRTDPRIAAYVHAALGDARTVLNVGAGAGSYEPLDRYVVAVEPARAMRAQRRPDAPAIDATAEDLPFDDRSFDAVMATVTIHQWTDLDRGLAELRRVSRGPVVILTFDGAAFGRFWLADYVPELAATELRRAPAIEAVCAQLGGRTTVTAIPVPIDCVDGLGEAYYARPEAFLDPAVRQSQSAWVFVDSDTTAQAIARLTRDLESGEWDRRYGHLRTQPEYPSSLRLIVSQPD